MKLFAEIMFHYGGFYTFAPLMVGSAIVSDKKFIDEGSAVWRIDDYGLHLAVIGSGDSPLDTREKHSEGTQKLEGLPEYHGPSIQGKVICGKGKAEIHWIGIDGRIGAVSHEDTPRQRFPETLVVAGRPPVQDFFVFNKPRFDNGMKIYELNKRNGQDGIILPLDPENIFRMRLLLNE